jgi:hypothetical protein
LVSKALLTFGVGTATVIFATFIGTFTSQIFENTAEIFEQINSGKNVTITSVISDSDMARFKNVPEDVKAMQEESK